MAEAAENCERNAADDKWKCWCRLCAKDDAKNVNLLPGSVRLSVPLDINLVDFIEEFFRINMKTDADLPKLLCTQCVSLISLLIKYVEHVKQVQNMYDAIRLTGECKLIDLRMMREKYNLSEDYVDAIKTLHHEILLDKSTKSAIERVFVTDAPDTSLAKSALDTIVKSEIIGSDEVQSELFVNGAEQKIEFEDPIGNVSEQHFYSDDECYSECKANIKKNLEVKLYEGNNERDGGKEPKTKSPCSEGSEPQEPKYFCASCSLHFHRIGNYRVHMKKKHEMTKEPLTCPQCNKIFKSKFKLNRHIQTHRPPEEKKIFPCPQCDRKFQTKDYVTKHIKFVHEDIRPFICEECGEAVRTETTLREHMLIHTDYAPFECDVCKKGFKNQYRLKNHKEMHSSNKHICSECGLQLNSRVTLNRHMLVHSDVMRHKCDYCGRAFKRAKTLKNHLILHSGLKPYSCDFCDRTFATGANCRTHKRKSHPEELAALEAAGGKTYTKNIPKLSVLKTVTRSAENLIPVVSKNSGNFSLGKRPKPQPCSLDGTKSSKIHKNSATDGDATSTVEPSETVQSNIQTSDKDSKVDNGNLAISEHTSSFWKY